MSDSLLGKHSLR